MTSVLLTVLYAIQNDRSLLHSDKINGKENIYIHTYMNACIITTVICL